MAATTFGHSSPRRRSRGFCSCGSINDRRANPHASIAPHHTPNEHATNLGSLLYTAALPTSAVPTSPAPRNPWHGFTVCDGRIGSSLVLRPVSRSPGSMDAPTAIHRPLHASHPWDKGVGKRSRRRRRGGWQVRKARDSSANLAPLAFWWLTSSSPVHKGTRRGSVNPYQRCSLSRVQVPGPHVSGTLSTRDVIGTGVLSQSSIDGWRQPA